VADSKNGNRATIFIFGVGIKRNRAMISLCDVECIKRNRATIFLVMSNALNKNRGTI